VRFDIIKSHRGEMKVDTKEGDFAEFSIVLQSEHIVTQE
jgi:hypothetical protein